MYALTTGILPFSSAVFSVDINKMAQTSSPTAIHGWTCVIGLLAAFGVQVVANFQETVIFKVHITGKLQ